MSGGILSDRAIADAVARKTILIDPFDAAQLNPASYDMTLGDTVVVYSDWAWDEPTKVIDVKTEPRTKSYVIRDDGWLLRPGILYLMHTRETIAPGKLVACMDGKSSLARLGIVVHLTSGYIDPGFAGQITLEVTVVHPVRVYAGMRFCQVRFHTTLGESSGYKGNYVGEHARGPVPSRAWKQFK